ncbi:MAG: CPBP family intramembrane metalloprotease [Burkholderiales bacterium]|nr:CPBP family intramembrane metalloprotease [Burkholderiales bacterium]
MSNKPDDLLQRWADAWRGEPRALARAGATLLAYASGYVAGAAGFAWLLRHVVVVAWPDPTDWGREALRLLDIGMTFGAALAAFLVARRALGGMRAPLLCVAASRARRADAIVAVLLWWAASLAIVLALGDPDRVAARLQSHPPTDWALLAALALLLVGVQATSEEPVFRGYLLPRLAVRLPSAAAVAVSALVFAAAHPSPGLWGGTLLTWFGVVFGVATWRSGSVWPAVGLHVSHNVLQILLAPWVPVGAAEFAAHAAAALLWLGWIEWLRRQRARLPPGRG